MADARTILVVDDDEAHLLWSTEILTEHGYEIDSTCSASDALNMLSTQKYDLIISDLIMPEMSGIDFMKKVSKKHKDQKAIIMTGHGDIDTFIESVYDAGALEYIIKPVAKNDFIAMVDKLTDPTSKPAGLNNI